MWAPPSARLDWGYLQDCLCEKEALVDHFLNLNAWPRLPLTRHAGHPITARSSVQYLGGGL